MKTLITGATGFIGSNLVRHLLEKEESLTCLVRHDSDTHSIDGLDVELAYGDITDVRSLRRILQDCNRVYHLVARPRLYVPGQRRRNTQSSHSL
jgi:dihydroflavonol-4-reductase